MDPLILIKNMASFYGKTVQQKKRYLIFILQKSAVRVHNIEIKM